MKYRQIFAFLLLTVILISPSVYATCSVISISHGDFGTVTSQNNINQYLLAEIEIQCDTPTETYRLGIDAGQHQSGYRQLKHSNGDTLSYQLFQGNNPTEWGDREMPISTYSQAVVSGSGSQIYPLYASAATKDQTPDGLYTDTINVILDNNGVSSASSKQIRLQLEAFCTLDTSQVSGEFGTYPIGSQNISNVNLGSIHVNCPNTTAYKIGINKGKHLNSGVRQMAFDHHMIAYTIKQGNGGAEWGDKGLQDLDPSYTETFSAANPLSQTGTGATQAFELYGDAIIETINTTGRYTDTLIVTLIW
ncbi:MAG: spore coat protein U domain-containing protein [Methylococcales bacterium]|nr:spore coat protein U domain-containing protein [Methylococcales bacterium]